jgi:hypothetical protein
MTEPTRGGQVTKRVALVLDIAAAMGVVPSIASADNGSQAVESQLARPQQASVAGRAKGRVVSR